MNRELIGDPQGAPADTLIDARGKPRYPKWLGDGLDPASFAQLVPADPNRHDKKYADLSACLKRAWRQLAHLRPRRSPRIFSTSEQALVFSSTSHGGPGIDAKVSISLNAFR